jgi:hypothetical protein
MRDKRIHEEKREREREEEIGRAREEDTLASERTHDEPDRRCGSSMHNTACSARVHAHPLRDIDLCDLCNDAF